MAVPDTTTFSLQDVITEIGLSNTSSLRDCFNNAQAEFFDPAYEGSKDRLSNFRNYGASEILTISPSISVTLSNSAQILNITITSNTDWVAEESSSWMTTPSPSSGNGNGSTSVSILSNAGATRNDDIIVRTVDSSIIRTLNVTQGTNSVELFYSVSTFEGACMSGVGTIYYIDLGSSFITTENLWMDLGNTTPATAGWYSNHTSARFWNGLSFTGPIEVC